MISRPQAGDQRSYSRRPRARNVLAACVTMCAAASGLPTANAWESELLSRGSDGRWTPNVVRLGDQSWSLPDFSYTGYRLGLSPLAASVACRVEHLEARPGDDIATAIESAIRRLARRGGGILRLPTGTFRLSRSVGIVDSGIAIEGAGSDRTRLIVPESHQPADGLIEGVFSFGRNPPKGWRQGWWSQAPVLTEVTQAIEAGDQSLTVASSRGLRTGQWIAVTQALWPAASKQWSNGEWPGFQPSQRPTGSDRLFEFVYLRKITAIHGDRVRLDAPIPWRLHPKDNTIRVVAPDESPTPPLENVGLSGVSIDFESKAGTARPNGIGVTFEGVRDAWLHDVAIANVPRFGVLLTHSARVSIAESAVQGMQDSGGGGWGYGFYIFASQDVLLRNTVAEQLRHGVTLSRLPTSNVVVSGHRSLGSTQDGDDSHHGPVQQVLFDQHQGLYGAGLRMVYRGTKSNGAHETLASGVVWNAGGDRSRGLWYGHGVVVDPFDAGWAMIVGVSPERWVMQDGHPIGAPPIRRVPASNAPHRLAALPGRAPGAATGNVYYEGIGRSGLEPASLYEAQLQRRTGVSSTRYRDDCEPTGINTSAARRVQEPSSDLLFSDTTQSAVVDLNSAFSRVLPASTAGTAVSRRIQITDTAPKWTPLVTLHHEERSTTRRPTLHVRLGSTAPTRLLVQLRGPALPHQDKTYSKVAEFEIMEKKPTFVALPVPDLEPGDTFDAVVLKSSGLRSGATITIEDIQLR